MELSQSSLSPEIFCAEQILNPTQPHIREDNSFTIFFTSISARSVTFCNSNHHQDVQERCRREVLEVLGDEKAAVADMPKMPFVLATIAEV